MAIFARFVERTKAGALAKSQGDLENGAGGDNLYGAFCNDYYVA